MVSIEEAIAHAREIANKNSGCWKHCNCTTNDCKSCPEEHGQLAEWLEELKAYRENSNGYNKEDIELNRNAMYNKAIDDFAERLTEELSHTTLQKDGYYLANIIKPLAEQLKAGGENENYNKEENDIESYIKFSENNAEIAFEIGGISREDFQKYK